MEYDITYTIMYTCNVCYAMQKFRLVEAQLIESKLS